MSTTSRLMLQSLVAQQFQLAGGIFFVDTDQADTNLDPENSTGGNITRINIFTDTSLTSSDINSGNYYYMAEASNYFTDNVGPAVAQGNWYLNVRFRDSGLTLISSPGLVGTTDAGNLLTNVVTIPSGTQYIDTLWALVPLFPLFLTGVNFSDRYRRISALPVTNSPNGHTTTAARPQVTI